MKRFCLRCVAAPFLVLMPACCAAQSDSVELWIRSFIPDTTHAGAASKYIVHAPGSMNASMVQLHYFDASLHLPNQCFITDNRSFSTDAQLSARAETHFTLTLTDGVGSVSPAPRTTPNTTYEVDCATGAADGQALGVIGVDTMGTPAVADGTVQVIGEMQAENVMTYAMGAAPAIDNSVDVQWTPATSTLILSTTYGAFPAYEVYARQPGAAWTPVLQALPTGTPWALGGDSFGINSLHDVKTVVIGGASGMWRSGDAAQRFTLQIRGKRAVWTERSAAGQTLSREVALKEQADHSFRLERPNDAEALTFSGYQPSLRAEILARAPKPSYMVIRMKGKVLKADWNELTVIKDGKAHLQQLSQPGTQPAKQYDLSRP